MDGETIAATTLAQLHVISGGDLSRINSLATDTCPLMRKAWRVLQHNPEINHAFIVPCNSYGLQLLIKDIILKLPKINETFKAAAALISSFHTSPKQYAILRAKQVEIIGKRIAFIASIETR